MNVNGQSMQSLWVSGERSVTVIDQRVLPHQLETVVLHTAEDAAAAIKEMTVRGAPLIGVTAAYGMWLASLQYESLGTDAYQAKMQAAATQLKATRPTAVNLAWAVDQCLEVLASKDYKASDAAPTLKQLVDRIREEDIAACRKIGEHGLPFIEAIAATKAPGEPVRILTHCNAGWAACIDYGTATSPIYQAYDQGIAVEVYVDETRPRNQGSNLTAWELQAHGIPVQLIVDNAGGHLMQHGLVDMVIVGSDRTTRNGDVANKIGTYLKALAARDNGIPFYVALPTSTIDRSLGDGLKEIPIEDRGPDEVRYVQGLHDGSTKKVLICPEDTPATNPGFDVTPAPLVTRLITEKGVVAATEEGVSRLF